MLDPAQVTGWVALGGAVATAVLKWSKIAAGVGKGVRRLFSRKHAASGTPESGLAIVPEVQVNSLWWHQGSNGDRPALHVGGDFNVTSTGPAPLTLVGAKLRYREGLQRKTTIGMVFVRDLRSGYSGRYPLVPNAMTHARADFFVPNATREPIRALKADLALIDQFGKEHWIKSVTFKHTDHLLDS